MSGNHVLAIDQGTTGSTALVLDPDADRHRPRLRRVRPALPPSRLGRARPRRHLAQRLPRRRGGARRCRHRGAGRSPRSASPTSARPSSSGTARPASRSPRPSSGRTGAPPASARSCAPGAWRPLVRSRTGLVIDAYFSGTKVAWLLDHTDGLRAAGRARRARLRHRRLVAPAPHDRRHGARHRRHQRQPHACSTTSAGSTGTTSCSPSCGCPGRCCPRCARASAASARPTRRSFLGVELPVRRHARRPAGRRCSPRPATSPGRPRTPTGPGSFVLMNTGDTPVLDDTSMIATIALGTTGPDGATELRTPSRGRCS